MSTIVSPVVPLNDGNPPSPTLRTAQWTTAGILEGTWIHESRIPTTRPQAQAPLLRSDRRITAYDFMPGYDDAGYAFLLFEPHVTATSSTGTYTLMSISLWPRDPQTGIWGTRRDVFKWHLVVSETMRELPPKRARPSMRSDDRKVAKKDYGLENGASVPDSWIHPDAEWARMVVIGCGKFLLAVDWKAGVDLVGGELDV